MTDMNRKIQIGSSPWMKQVWLWLLAVSLGWTACDRDETLNYHASVAEIYEGFLGGGMVDTFQFWKTAVTLDVQVKTTRTTEVVAYVSDSEEYLLCDRKTIDGDGTVRLTIPQGISSSVLVVGNDGTKRISQTITLTGKPIQEVSVVFPKPITAQADLRVSAALNGTDIQSNIGYVNLSPEGLDIMLNYVKEGMDAADLGSNVNYELISNGPFDVTLLYGFTGAYQPRILGYYRHSPGTYADLEFVDLLDTHSYDYINGVCKIQYQLDGNTDKWYDSNFDYRDGFDPPYTSVSARLGDDAYNINWVLQKYGSRVTDIRGLTYHIDVKPGDRIGFYLRMSGKENSAQRAAIVRKGIPGSVLPQPFYETNFSAQVLNTDSRHRSAIVKDSGFTLMGLEDDGSSGDHDCNDVVFGLHAELETEMPTIVDPEVDGIVDGYALIPWTIGYEDVGRKADFDFNDAVIQIRPDYAKEECTVKLMAAGCSSDTRMYLHYDGPDGDQNLGEIHQLFGGGDWINTRSSMVSVPFVDLGTVRWLKSYTMATDANRFYVEVKRGECHDCSDVIRLADVPGQMPQAVCVVGNWRWPLEETSIFTTYTLFSRWAKNVTSLSYWTWYNSPKKDTYVEYE